jgi:hypothetical protein
MDRAFSMRETDEEYIQYSGQKIPKGRDDLGNLVVDGRIIVMWILNV